MGRMKDLAIKLEEGAELTLAEKVFVESQKIKRTSKEWQELYPGVLILDPDGWDRQNFQYSWYEEQITYEEYFKRLQWSTVKGGKDDYMFQAALLDIKKLNEIDPPDEEN